MLGFDQPGSQCPRIGEPFVDDPRIQRLAEKAIGGRCFAGDLTESATGGYLARPDGPRPRWPAPELAWTGADFPENKPYFSPLSDTLLEKSRGVVFRHPIFALEFSFKPVRMIEVPVTNPDGTESKKLVWYLLYQVRYLGNDLAPNVTQAENGIAVPDEPKKVKEDWVLFVPRFTLTTTQKKIEYTERILPDAKGLIAAKERVGAPILDSFEMMRKIPVSDAQKDNPFWGVATWTDVDPTTDFFVVTVEGLTNAYRIVGEGATKKYEKKCLQLHFWRPGDSIAEKEDVIRLGVPAFEEPARVQYAMEQFGIKERLDYKWVYR